jgi:hypothetical protein
MINVAAISMASRSFLGGQSLTFDFTVGFAVDFTVDF